MAENPFEMLVASITGLQPDADCSVVLSETSVRILMADEHARCVFCSFYCPAVACVSDNSVRVCCSIRHN